MIKGIISRRASQRIPFQAEITIQFYVENSEPVVAQTTNISLEGLRFFVPKGLIKLAPEDSIELVFNIGDSQIEVKGEVCYFANAFDNEHKPVVYYGIKFTELSAETWKTINDYCTAKLAAGDSASEFSTSVKAAQKQPEKDTELTTSIDSIDFGLSESDSATGDQTNSDELLIDSVFELQPEGSQEPNVSNTETTNSFTDIQIDSIFELQQSGGSDSDVSLSNTISNSGDIQIDSIFDLEQPASEPIASTVEHVIPFEFLSSSLNPVSDINKQTPESVLPDPVPLEPLNGSISPDIKSTIEPVPESVLPDPVPLEPLNGSISPDIKSTIEPVPESVLPDPVPLDPFINPVETPSTSDSKPEPVIDVGNPFRSLSQEIIDKLIDSMSSNQNNSKSPTADNAGEDHVQTKDNKVDNINNNEVVDIVSDEPVIQNIETEPVNPIEETKEKVTTEPVPVNNEPVQEFEPINLEANLNDLSIDQSELNSLLEQAVTDQIAPDESPEVSQSEINSLFESNNISNISTETEPKKPVTPPVHDSNQPVESKVDKVDKVDKVEKVDKVDKINQVEPVKEPLPASPSPDIVIDTSKIPNFARGSSTVPMDQKMIDQLIEKLVPKNKPSQQAPVNTSNEPETFSVKLETLNGDIINCKIVRLYFGGIIIESPQRILENSPYKISISSNTTEINNITGICSMCEQIDSNNYKAEFFFKGLSNSNMDMEILKSIIAKLQNK
ncbi:MAG TPA: PilZ domain-containing protein [Bacillota bacterium]|nr:PilZ domain-containing protein [Bacillota bacterium]